MEAVIYTDGVHVITDGEGFDELHAFAARIGLRRSWFQGDHYDLTTRAAATRAVAAGATLIDVRDLGRLRILLRRGSASAAGLVAAVSPDSCVWLDDGWRPTPLDPALAADKNTELMRRFAPGKRIGRRGVDHL